MLKSPLFWKITTLIGCIVLLSLPLMMVRELINERADYRSEVVDAIEQSTSGSQKLAGPLIAIPITETLTRMENQKRSTISGTGCITGCRSRWRSPANRPWSRGGWASTAAGLA